MPDGGAPAALTAPPRQRFVDLKTGLLLFLTGCAMAGSGLVAPVLSIYGQAFSASAALVGMLLTIFGIGRLAINFPTGLIARRTGTKALLVAGNGLLLVGALGAAVSPTLELLLLCRLVQGIGSGVYLTAAGIVIAETSRPGARGRFMALYQGAVFTGAGIGPVVGGFLAERFGITAPFWAYAAISLAAVVVSLRFPAQSAAAPPPGSRGPSLWFLLRNLKLVAVYFVSFASGFTRTAALWQMVPLLAVERFRMSLDAIGLALTVIAFANLALLPVSGWLTDRLSARRMTPLATLLLAASILSVAIDTGPLGFWAGMAALGLANSLVGPASAVSLVEAVDHALLGPALGANRTFADLGFVLGPVLIGTLVDALAIGPAGGLVAIACLVALAALSYWAVGRLSRDAQAR